MALKGVQNSEYVDFQIATSGAQGSLPGRGVTIEDARNHLKTSKLLLDYAEKKFGIQSPDYATASKIIIDVKKI